MDRLWGLVGLLFFIGVATLFSTNRRRISWRLVLWGLGIQFLFAILILPESFFNVFVKDAFELEQAPGAFLFSKLNGVVNGLLEFTKKGTDFLIFSSSLGRVADSFDNFVFGVLPTILFFSSVMAILYHVGIIQRVVSVIAKMMARTMGTSGSESLSAAANIFVGQTEAPLVIRPYVESMTRSELLAVMTGGMATVAGGIMAAYVAFLSDVIPDIAGHLIAASVMSAPAALVVSKILIPEEEESLTQGKVKLDVPKTSANVIDAAAQGAADGLTLALNVGAMLLVFIALIALINFPIQWIGANIFGTDLSLERILGWVLSPLAFLMGVPWKDATEIGALLGKKTIVNEFVAFYDLSLMVKTPEYLAGQGLDRKSVIITTYALCGFSNFSSIAIQIGGIGGIAPLRKKDLAALGLRALLAGSFACFMTACIAGVLMPGTPGTGSGGILGKKVIKQVYDVRRTPLNDDFHLLKSRMLSMALPRVRADQWSSAKGRTVAWTGRLFSVESTGKGGTSVRVYYGIKNAARLRGDELNDYASFVLKETPARVKVRREGRFVDVPWQEVLRGDEVKLTGSLEDLQVSPAVLFLIEGAEFASAHHDGAATH